ncbi:Aste57867_20525 [Aphanomyces stellatus]|uniref:Aste57867_20525 protein n=1 Tax=Aphanomyces stellatus TaxID=120398 RepID=A0A485LFS8_9STRA|nr:hypothetical protein As57867_020458 [Aphanomyces stellatus]VFT97210.1 Aste57867_20525 [Aphanomyces stellatus]
MEDQQVLAAAIAQIEEQWRARESNLMATMRTTIVNEVRAEWEVELNRRLEEASAANTQLPGHDDSELDLDDEEMGDNALTMQRIGDILESQMDPMTIMVMRQSSGSTKLRVKGINMPQYKGEVGEILNLFMWNVKVFFAARNLDADAPDNQKRCIVMIVANLRGVAGSWYQNYITRTGIYPSNPLQLETLLRAEFVPSDLQECFWGSLAGISQKSVCWWKNTSTVVARSWCKCATCLSWTSLSGSIEASANTKIIIKVNY